MRTFHRDDLIGKLPPDAAFLANRINAETTFDAEGFTRGEVSYWIPVIVDSKMDTLDNVLAWWRWMTVGEEIPPERVGLMEQMSSLLLFDLLTNNSDRFSGGNLMTSKDGKVLFWMDNTFGFQIEPEGHLRCRTYLFRCQKFSRKMIAALRRLDLPTLKQAIDHIRIEMDQRLKWYNENGMLLEAQRLEQRTRFDLEMMETTGSCAGIENYSRYLTGRLPGEPPPTLFEYLPKDTLVFVDEL